MNLGLLIGGMKNMKTYITARSICDYDCIFKAEVIKRTAKTLTVKAMGIERRCKIQNISGELGVYALGKYSMAPFFKLESEVA